MRWKKFVKFLASLGLLIFFLIGSAVTNTGQAAAISADRKAPPGFKLLYSAPGVWLYQKDYPNGNPDFVQVIDLSQGAQIKLFHGLITDPGEGEGVYGGDNPRIKRRSMESFWNEFTTADPNAFCITNGQFFYLPEDPTRIAFPLKVDGKFVSDGYGIKEYPEKKLMLELWDDHADIRELSPEALNTSSAPNIIAGLTEEANKKGKFYLGRTFTGIDDRDRDGAFETLFLFSTLSARQVDAARVLKTFGADKVMMLDGGGSAQLICQGVTYVDSERYVPQAVGVAAGPEPTPTASIEKLERVEALPKAEQTQVTPYRIAGGRINEEMYGTALVVKPEEARVPPSPVSLKSLMFVPLAMLPIAALLFFVLSKASQEKKS